MDPTGTHGSTAQRGASRAALAILALAQFLLALDYSIVYVALPSVGEGMEMSESSVQWVISGYAVFFAGFLIVGGRCSDRFGPRNIYLAGMLLFGVASLAGGLAPNAMTLMAARAGQGMAAALLQPAVIALISTSFPAGPERNRALSVWGTVGASGLAVGVMLGGILTTVSWRWVFLINLPVAVLCILLTPRVLPKAAAVARPEITLNVRNGVLCTGTVLLTALALTRASDSGWGDGMTLALFTGAVVLLVAFVLGERSSSHPLVDPLVRRTRSLLVGCGSTAMYMASVGNMFFVVTLLLQQLQDYGPLRAGLAFLPMAVAIALANAVSARLVGAVGIRATLALAFVANAVGLLLLASQVHGDSYLVNLLPGLVVTGLAHGVTYVAMFIAGTSDVADKNQGLAGALMTTAQYMSGALGIAVLVLVLGPQPDADDFGWAFVATAVAAVLGAVLAWLGLRKPATPAEEALAPPSAPLRTPEKQGENS